jgi:hypothetical protein
MPREKGREAIRECTGSYLSLVLPGREVEGDDVTRVVGYIE